MASHYIGANSLETGRGYTAGGLNINIPTWGPAVSPGHPLICAIKLISILMPCKSLPWLICQKKKWLVIRQWPTSHKEMLSLTVILQDGCKGSWGEKPQSRLRTGTLIQPDSCADCTVYTGFPRVLEILESLWILEKKIDINRHGSFESAWIDIFCVGKGTHSLPSLLHSTTERRWEEVELLSCSLVLIVVCEFL